MSIPAPVPFRIGHGFDLHRLEPGRRLVLAGTVIPAEAGCVAHSDGDVVFHAVVDALMGALGREDIGQLFPDTDPRWKDADSAQFLRAAAARVADDGWKIGNLDATVVLQQPKLAPHKAAMRARLAEVLGVAAEQVNLKAKTHEKVDAVGEGRAVECHAVVLLYR